jgi:hypothetical protein
MPMFKGFRFMERAWDLVNSMPVKQGQWAHESLPRFSPSESKGLRLACLTLYYVAVYSEVLQWRHRLDLARGGEHSRLRALGWR